MPADASHNHEEEGLDGMSGIPVTEDGSRVGREREEDVGMEWG